MTNFYKNMYVMSIFIIKGFKNRLNLTTCFRAFIHNSITFSGMFLACLLLFILLILTLLGSMNPSKIM